MCSIVLSLCSGAQRSPLDPIPDGAWHSEGLERHGAHLAVCVFERPASDILRGGEIPYYVKAQASLSVYNTRSLGTPGKIWDFSSALLSKCVCC